jgi:hypothetical protein
MLKNSKKADPKLAIKNRATPKEIFTDIAKRDERENNDYRYI